MPLAIHLRKRFLQGFMELVERDAVGIWWYNRIQRPAVDLHSFDLDYICRLQKFYQRHQRELWVLDLTTDLNIPVFAGISRRHDREREDILLGFGAHLDPQIALLRALTEVNQSFSSFLALDDDTDLPDFQNVEGIHWWKTATIANQPYLRPQDTIRPKHFGDFPKMWTDDILDDVTTCVDLLAERNIETLVLDQTQPDVGLNVVKVFAPGLRHFWRRLAPGRLFDVPVQMGWLDKPLAESDLNPLSVYF